MSFFNKLLDDPLKTAAIGSALYFGAPALMGAMGSGAAGEGLLAGEAGVLGGGGEAFGKPLASGMTEQMGDWIPEGGLMSKLPSFKDAASYAQPVSHSLMAASAAKGLLGDSSPRIQSHAPQMNPQSGQALAQLYQPYQMQPRQRVNWG